MKSNLALPLLFVALIPASCGQQPKGDSSETDSLTSISESQQDTRDQLTSDKQTEITSGDEEFLASGKPNEEFEGVYGIGEWRVIIKPAHMSFELYDAEATDPEPILLLFSEHLGDSIFVYEHPEDDQFRYFRLEMQPNHYRGMYYETDEQWEVRWYEVMP